MPRTARASKADVCHHVISRGNNRNTVFHDDEDYSFFEKLLARGKQRIPIRIFAWCLMPNHFHLVLCPYRDGDLSRFLHWLLTTQVHYYRRRHKVHGRIWGGRFKAPPIQTDHHLLTVMRYVERNPVRANFVGAAKSWDWSSFNRRTHREYGLLDAPVLDLPRNWAQFVDQPLTASELAAVRQSLEREKPFGDPAWTRSTAERLGLGSQIRPRGRPRRNDAE